MCGRLSPSRGCRHGNKKQEQERKREAKMNKDVQAATTLGFLTKTPLKHALDVVKTCFPEQPVGISRDTRYLQRGEWNNACVLCGVRWQVCPGSVACGAQSRSLAQTCVVGSAHMPDATLHGHPH